MASRMGIDEANVLVTRMLEACGIRRLSGKADLLFDAALATSIGPQGTFPSRQARYSSTIKLILSTRPTNLDTLTLIGALFREAYLATALDVASTLAEEFTRLIESFCSQEWLENRTATELKDLATQRVLHWQLGADWLGDGTYYDDSPINVVERTLLPLDNQIDEYLSKHDKALFKLLARSVRVLTEDGHNNSKG